MTRLLELKERIFRFCSENERELKYVYKFSIALFLLWVIDVKVGFMENISNFPTTLALAALCCLLPQNTTLFIVATVVTINLYALSVEVAFTAVLIFVLIFLLYFRFAPKDGLIFALTPICFMLHIPYVLPIGIGLFRKVKSVAAVLCGTIVYYFLDGIYQNVTALQATSVVKGEVETIKITITAGQLLSNKEMYLTILVFFISSIVVYVIRNMDIDKSWKVATFAGTLVQFSALFVGYLIFDITGKTAEMFFGNLLAFFIGIGLEFLFMDLDYSRTEKVQFEDDDYYYFVKAVPKKMITTSEKEVIHFSGRFTMDKIKEMRKKKEKQ